MEQHEMGIDAINDAQDTALSALRLRIREKQASVFASAPVENPFPVAELSLVDVPEVMSSDEPEFQLERHAEIIFRLEALYNNYLFRLKVLRQYPVLTEAQDAFETSLKELCRAQEKLLSESLKPRF